MKEQIQHAINAQLAWSAHKNLQDMSVAMYNMGRSVESSINCMLAVDPEKTLLLLKDLTQQVEKLVDAVVEENLIKKAEFIEQYMANAAEEEQSEKEKPTIQ